MTRPLNILYIHSHDTGRCVEPYGYDVATPRIQRFAEESLVFRQAFAAAPTCSPSRAALMTGQHPHCCGMYGLATDKVGYTLNDYSHHLARFLKTHGYTTALAGVQHVARLPWADPAVELGYDQMLNSPETTSGRNPARNAAAFLKQPRDRPFFLSVGFGETHRDNGNQGRRHSYAPDAPFVETLDGRYRRPPAPIPDTATTRQDWASFRDGARRLDDKVGAVLDALDDSGHADNTLVILTTDHGIAWPHGKGNLTDAGLGVMLILRGPADSGFAGGRVLDAMVSHMDLYPTICELLGVDAPDWLQGASLMPLARGEAEQVHDQLFGEQSYHGKSFDPQRSVRTERYKYIRRGDGPYIRIVDPGPTNDWLRSVGFRQLPAGRELLYDLYLDPNEMNNRIDDPELADVLSDLRARLDRWMDDTDDPFRDGSIPIPPALAAAQARGEA